MTKQELKKLAKGFAGQHIERKAARLIELGKAQKESLRTALREVSAALSDVKGKLDRANAALGKIGDNFYAASGVEGGEFDVAGTQWTPADLIKAVRKQAAQGANAAKERAEAKCAEHVAALRGILEIGKRDMSNPKYDSYFESAKQICAKGKPPMPSLNEPCYIVLVHGECGIMTPTVFLAANDLHAICRELNCLIDRLHEAEALIAKAPEKPGIGWDVELETAWVREYNKWRDELEQALSPGRNPTPTPERCECGCCHVPDYGACNEFHVGGNDRCVYCDHGEPCHERDKNNPYFNGPLSVYRRRSANT